MTQRFHAFKLASDFRQYGGTVNLDLDAIVAVTGGGSATVLCSGVWITLECSKEALLDIIAADGEQPEMAKDRRGVFNEGENRRKKTHGKCLPRKPVAAAARPVDDRQERGGQPPRASA